MTFFVLHENSGRSGDDSLICLRDHFNWFAFFLPPVWALYNRLWRPFLAMLAFVIIMVSAAQIFILPISALYFLGVLWLGFEANSLKGAALLRRGWKEADYCEVSDVFSAEQAFFERKARA